LRKISTGALENRALAVMVDVRYWHNPDVLRLVASRPHLGAKRTSPVGEAVA
jgi:hypothetical protein